MPIKMETMLTKIRELDIDGNVYKITTTKQKKKPSHDKVFSRKLAANLELQDEEVKALRIIYKDKFRIENEQNKKYSIELFIRGGPDATIDFSFPPEYPSDVPPTYTLHAPWAREKTLKDLYQRLTNIYTKYFGQCIMYRWVEQILEDLKKENTDLKYLPEEVPEEEAVVKEAPVEEEKCPSIFEGEPIWDRKSCFSPYIAEVHSEEDVRLVIEKIEDCRKVSTAWRNTFAYRFKTSKGKLMEVGEDGGEPKAGRNLLQRLVNYGALDVIVYISRRVGGSLLGPDRFRHLNDAADQVLVKQGYKRSAPPAEKAAKGGGKKKGGKRK